MAMNSTPHYTFVTGPAATEAARSIGLWRSYAADIWSKDDIPSDVNTYYLQLGATVDITSIQGLGATKDILLELAFKDCDQKMAEVAYGSHQVLRPSGDRSYFVVDNALTQTVIAGVRQTWLVRARKPQPEAIPEPVCVCTQTRGYVFGMCLDCEMAQPLPLPVVAEASTRYVLMPEPIEDPSLAAWRNHYESLLDGWKVDRKSETLELKP